MKHWSRFSADPRKASLADHLRKWLTRAVFLRSEKPDERKAADSDIHGFHRLALPAKIEGVHAHAWFNALRPKDGGAAVFHKFGLFEENKRSELPKDSQHQGNPEEASFKSGPEETVASYLEKANANPVDHLLQRLRLGGGHRLRGAGAMFLLDPGAESSKGVLRRRDGRLAFGACFVGPAESYHVGAFVFWKHLHG